jgi:hypothetical protein
LHLAANGRPARSAEPAVCEKFAPLVNAETANNLDSSPLDAEAREFLRRAEESLEAGLKNRLRRRRLYKIVPQSLVD